MYKNEKKKRIMQSASEVSMFKIGIFALYISRWLYK